MSETTLSNESQAAKEQPSEQPSEQVAVGSTRVTFLPGNQTFPAEVGQTILEVALANHIPLDHACGGVCACSTCHVIVKKGMTQLSELEDNEADQLDEAAGLTLASRLGCQSQILREGEVVVEIPEWNRNYSREGEH